MTGDDRAEQNVSKVSAGRDLTVNQLIGDTTPLPLHEPFPASSEEVATSHLTLLSSLRASERRVPLIGRTQIVRRAIEWAAEPPPGNQSPDHRVLVIHGPGGAGKTRLAAEILTEAGSADWTAGFLAGNPPVSTDWSRLAHPSEPLMIAVDYAEARHDDLHRLLESAPVGHHGDAPLRLILIVREGKAEWQSWSDRLGGGTDLGSRAERLLADGQVETVSLDRSLPEVAQRAELWRASFASYAGEEREPRTPLDDELFERPLFVLLDAYREFAGESDGGDGEVAPPSAEALIAGVLKHESGYWLRSLDDAELRLDARSMHQVAVVATLVAGVPRPAFEDALAALDWLRDDAFMRPRVADWWCSVYATEAGAIRGIEPDIVGEYLVMRAMEDADAHSALTGSLRLDQLTGLIETTTIVGRQRTLRVLTRIANGQSADREQVKSILAEIVRERLDDLLPATFDLPDDPSEYGGVGESLATTVASAVLASDQLELVATRSNVEEGVGPRPDEAAQTAKSAAQRIVRQRVVDVAERELEAGRRLPGDYADLITWALKLDLEAGSYGQVEEMLERVRSLEPTPRHALAVMLMTIGRKNHEQGAYGDAEQRLREALAELDGSSEEDLGLESVIEHDLARALLRQGETQQAIRQLEQALAGKTKARGQDDSDTVTTLLFLTDTLAQCDLDGAIARLEEAEKMAGDTSQASRIRASKASARTEAARAAIEEAEYERADRLLHEARAEVAAAEQGGDAFTALNEYDLGELASAEGNAKLAIERLERALASFETLYGRDDEISVWTLLRLAQELRSDGDGEAANDRLAAAFEQLKDGDPERLEEVFTAWSTSLAKERRINESIAVTREFQALKLASESRNAVFEAAVDSTVYPPPPGIVSVDCCLIAAHVFPAGDPRLLPLASRIGALVITLTGELMGTLVADSPLEPAPEETREGDEMHAAMNQIDQIDPEYAEATVAALRGGADPTVLVMETIANLRDEVERIATIPAIASLAPAQSDPVAGLADDPAVRRWLGRMPFHGPFKDRPGYVQLLIAYLVAALHCLRDGSLRRPPAELVTAGYWRAFAEPAEIGEELALVAADLAANGVEDAEDLVRVTPAAGLLAGGRLAESEGKPAEAEALYNRAAAELTSSGVGSRLGAMIEQELGDVAAAQGQLDTAIERYERAFERISAGGHDSVAVETLLRLTTTLAKRDLEAALELLEENERKMLAAGVGEGQIARLRVGRARAHRAAGEVAAANGLHESSAAAFDQALAELQHFGESDTALRYRIEHDRAQAAAANGDPKLALEHYETSLEGKVRLRGIASADTVTTLLDLLVLLAATEGDAAVARFEQAERELVKENAGHEQLRRLREMLPRIRVEAGRSALSGGDQGAAKRHFEQALQALGAPEDSNTLSIAIVEFDLGRVATASGDRSSAIAHLERSYALRRRHGRIDDPNCVQTLLALLRPLREVDPRGALSRLEGICKEMRDADADATQLAEVEDALPASLILAGRKALAERDRDDARNYFERAQSFLAERGETQEKTFHVVEHDLAQLAFVSGQVDEAVERYERALNGKVAARGLAHNDTVTTLVALLDAKFFKDPDTTLAKAKDAIAEMQQAGADEKQIARVRAWIDRSTED